MGDMIIKGRKGWGGSDKVDFDTQAITVFPTIHVSIRPDAVGDMSQRGSGL